MKLGTDNYIWDNILNPNMKVHLVKTKDGLLRGMQMEYDYDGFGLVSISDSENNIGSNYKCARIMLINLYKKRFREVN